QLIRLRASQLKSLPGFGPKARQEVEEALDYFGLQLRPEPLPKPVPIATRRQHLPSTRNHQVAWQLLLPEMETLPRVCVGCRQALSPADSPERYGGRACRQEKRARPTPPAASNTVSVPNGQLALEV